MRLYFCADIGTSSLKAALIDSAGGLHGFARVPFANKESAPSWLEAFFHAARELASIQLPDSCNTVSALVISGNGPTLVPVKRNAPEDSLRPVFWYDPAPLIEGSASLFLPKLKAFYDAKSCNDIRFFLSSQEWLSWKLGARPVTALPHDGYIPYYWNDDECERLGINRELLPPFVTMGTGIGEIQPPALAGENLAAKLLRPGTPIIAGSADFIMAIIGTGTLESGKACDRTGSSEGLNLCAASVPGIAGNPAEHGGELRILPHAVSGLWNLGMVIPKSGILFEELKSKQTAFETVGRAFTGALDRLESFGYSIKELTLSGGQCNDDEWNQYKADISGRVLKIPLIMHAELAGNAVLAEAAFSGRTVAETAAAMIHINKIYVPVYRR